MSLSILVILKFATLSYAIVGGVFMAFSDFIMRSLSRTSGAGGVEAMQIINREVFRWIFMMLFMVLAPVSVGIALYGFLAVGGVEGAVLVAAGLVYFIGCFAVTVFFNVPLNEGLAKMSVTEPATKVYWQHTYVPRWTLWNTVRGMACIVSSIIMLLVLPLSN